MRTDARANRDRIVEAYLELIRPRGPQPTMAEVAIAADVARVTLYRHFADRDALRHAAFAFALDEADELVHEALAEPNPVDRALPALIAGLLSRGMRMHLLLNAQDYFEPSLVRRWSTWVRPISRYLKAAQDRGELRSDLPSGWLVESLLALIQAAIVARDQLSRRDRAAAVLTTFLDGARP